MYCVGSWFELLFGEYWFWGVEVLCIVGKLIIGD